MARCCAFHRQHASRPADLLVFVYISIVLQDDALFCFLLCAHIASLVRLVISGHQCLSLYYMTCSFFYPLVHRIHLFILTCTFQDVHASIKCLAPKCVSAHCGSSSRLAVMNSYVYPEQPASL
jgi:hypothetical protein